MAVKEEKYDPGYEAAYGGAYGENPCSSEPCSFSNGLSMFPSMCVCVCVCVRARACMPFKDLLWSGGGDGCIIEKGSY
jgi:hypothetical protein